MEHEPAAQLLERWQAGDQAAATELYRRYSKRLCALAEKLIGERLQQRVGSEDIMQSVLRTFFRRAQDGEFAIDHSGALWRLLVTITLNKVRKQAEKHKAGRRDVDREVSVGDAASAFELPCHEPTPAEAAELTDVIETTLADIAPPGPEIFRLAVQGYSTPEIATQLDCSRWKVRRILDRIGERLERRLRDG